MASFGERLKRSWNAFLGRDPTLTFDDYAYGSWFRPDRTRLTQGNERSIVTSIYNQIAVDCSAIDILHVLTDEDGNYTKTINDDLNFALHTRANLDQTGRDLIRDIVMSMFDEGCVAIVPVVTEDNPNETEGFKVLELRTGKVKEWYPHHVKVEVYNEDKGRRQDIVVDKDFCALVENPFYQIMNEPNSVAQRLIRTLNQIDRTNESNSAGKMDLIIQLPYPTRSKARQNQAESRRKQIEAQLTGSQYGIAYIDGSEHITQLNRAVENNLWEQAKDLTTQLFSMFGLAEEIFNGTAKEEVLLNYYNRTISPIMAAVCESMKVKFLSRSMLTRHHDIKYFRDPFKLVPVKELAEIADKFTRNEIMSSNEIRSVIGLKPSNDPKADQLLNSNLNHKGEDATGAVPPEEQGLDDGSTEETSPLDQALENQLRNGG